MAGVNLENCIIEIKRAIARIEEQIKVLFHAITEQKETSDRLHKEHFEDAEAACKSIGDLEMVITRHDVELSSIRQTMEKLADSVEELKDLISRTRGIAVGLGMAGGAMVSILTILAGFMG